MKDYIDEQQFFASSRGRNLRHCERFYCMKGQLLLARSVTVASGPESPIVYFAMESHLKINTVLILSQGDRHLRSE
jgi:hypothetical protein